ncbi:MAG: MipA/OmpV family protein [Burkholderiaceae bacterium]
MGRQAWWLSEPGATHGNRQHAQTYYGVTAAQAASSGNPVFNAKAGWMSCDLSLGLNYTIDNHWSASASIGRHERLNAAADSPLFATKKATVARHRSATALNAER